MRLARRQAIAVGLVAVAVVAGVRFSPGRVLAAARDLVFSPWFPVALGALYLARPFLAWPISALSVLVGYRYGVAVGLPVALAGTVGTSLIPYAGARRFGRVEGLLGRATDGARRFFDATGGLRGVVAARLAPMPAEPVSAAAGVGGVSLPAFVLGTLTGELPWTIAAVVAGDSMRTLTIDGATVDPRVVALAGVAALALLAGPAYRVAHQKVSAQS